ncbi:uncharacterized protein LOC127103288 [Lathyrus oleraceus]|uniref:uncharacterized protein LOC127103288 n=1 Tax=Pisum sativum TaxID=3888 RepID=UPI0021D38704|nr:uncharacterized protein LOC127103288 [Pisum sativum]
MMLGLLIPVDDVSPPPPTADADDQQRLQMIAVIMDNFMDLINSYGEVYTILSRVAHIARHNANVSAISLRSGKVTEPSPEKKNLEVTPEPSSVVVEIEPSVVVETEKEKEKEYVPPVPFPHRIMKNKRTNDGDNEREILDVFIKVAVNIPLLDVIKQVPKYAKFLKDLCTSKKRLKGNERVNLGRNISALIQPKQAIPQKCKDPGTFYIPCTIGIHTGLIIQLVNKSNALPIRVVEDVLVQVNDLIFPANFYILDIEIQRNDGTIAGRATYRAAYQTMVVEAESSNIRVGRKDVTHVAVEIANEMVQPDAPITDVLVDDEVAVTYSVSSATTYIEVATPSTKPSVHTNGAFPGGPIDWLMLKEYVNHVAYRLRQGEDLLMLKVTFHRSKMKNFPKTLMPEQV